MKVLWIVNTIFPYPAKQIGQKVSVFGGWMLGLLNSLNANTDIEIGVAAVYKGTDLKICADEKVKYYLLPAIQNTKYNPSLEEYWEEIIKNFRPDIIHIHGTEYPHSLSCLKILKNKNIKTVVSIQGLVSFCADVYLNGLDYKLIKKTRTIRDYLKNDTLFDQKRRFYELGIYETEILKQADYIIGRTNWDYSTSYGMIGKDKYFKCNETLRNEFYNYKWDYNKIDKHSIFFCQASYPIKGFHLFLEALNILKHDYPDVKVYVAGNNIIDTSSLTKKLKLTGYGKYLKTIIEKYDLNDNVIFTGLLSEKEMIELMLKCHVFVQSSLIENSSNALGEAMLLGMPSVASNVGGTCDTLDHAKDGFLYSCNEYHVLSNYIKRIFDDKKLAISFGKNATKHARKLHSEEQNLKDMINIYSKIINNERVDKNDK